MQKCISSAINNCQRRANVEKIHSSFPKNEILLTTINGNYEVIPASALQAKLDLLKDERKKEAMN